PLFPAPSIGCSPNTAPTGASPNWTPGLNATTRFGFKLVGGHILRDGRRLGNVRAEAVDTAVVDTLYEKLLVIKEKDADGNVIERERRTTVNHAMKSCRRAWNVAARRNPGKLPLKNPFSAMGLVSSPGDADSDSRRIACVPCQGGRNGLPIA